LLTCPDESFRDPQRAIKIAQAVTRMVPERASARRALSFALYRLGKWDEAEAAIERLVAAPTDDSIDAGALFVLAMIQWQKGEREEARRIYDRAIAIPFEKPIDPIVSTLAVEAAALLTPNDTVSPNIRPHSR
jgi:tetratricopeptide (TPR) repeat protein